MDPSPLIKILLVFAALLVLTRLKVHLGLALVFGGIALGLWAGRGVAQTAGDMGYALRLPELWLLLIITMLIFEFGRHLADNRNAQVIMNAARQWGGRHGRAMSLVAIPAAIGLVPMPGGALFSAPLVEQTAPGPAWDPAWKSAVNYWFRHTWEYWWPLYPVVIVTLSIFDMPMGAFILMQLPVSLAALGGGYWVLIRPHLTSLSQPDTAGGDETGRGWRIFVPLLLVILCTILLPLATQRLLPGVAGQTHKMGAMIVGLLLGLILILRGASPDARRRFIGSFVDRKVLSLIATIGGVVVFKALLDRSGLLPLAGERLVASGFPLWVIICILPFVAGLVTGIAIGFAGIAFPVLAGLAATPDTGLAPASTLLLGFAFGYMGMMWSPVHLCFVLTRGFFSVPVSAMYRYVIPASAFPMAVALALYAAMQRVGW